MTNPLRPYHDHDSFNAGYLVIYRPGIGLINTDTGKPITALLSLSIANKSSIASYSPGKGIGIRANDIDKNYVYDLEFLEYFDFNNLSELFRNLVWNFFKNYCKVLVSQPLEIVRLVLQVGQFDFSRPKKKEEHARLGLVTLDSDLDGEINYFQSVDSREVPSPRKHKRSLSRSFEKHRVHKIQPVSQHTVDIMTAIASKDGPLALFRGINAQFIHQTLSHTIEAWITGFISPFLGIPDPFFLDLTHSSDPVRSLWLSVTACVLTGVILMPLDLVKVRLMITQFNQPDELVSDGETSGSVSPVHVPITQPNDVNTRSIRESIRNYPLSLVLNPPPTVALLTILHQFSTTVFRKTAPYLIFIRFNIDAYSSPSLYTLTNLMLLIMEFFIKLPVENLLRKEQVRFLLQPRSQKGDVAGVVTIDNPDENLIVKYNSWTTEGSSFERIRNLNLFSGWRVGVLNIVGFWGYNILKSSSTLSQEKL